MSAPPPQQPARTTASTATTTTASSSSSSSTSFTIRAARPDDAAALGALAARTFVATFGHLYSSAADLDAFSRATYSAERMRADLLDPDFSTFLAVPHPAPAGTGPDDEDGPQQQLPFGFGTVRRRSRPPTPTPTTTASAAAAAAATDDDAVGHFVEIKRLYVDATHHGSGAGRALMDVLMETALAYRPPPSGGDGDGNRAAADAAAAAPTVWLTVWTGNARARRFYEKYGFCEAGACEFVVPGIKDSLVYVLRREG
ncbi:acetyltransferase [Zopfochytrium polystomum]|nr:acetyltransferase [Zopfochytrium polystomum]